MKRNALRVLAALGPPQPVGRIARLAGVPAGSASRAIGELEALGFAKRSRKGMTIEVEAMPFSSLMALRDELARHRRLDLGRVAQGRRAAFVAGLGFARPPFLCRVTSLSPSASRLVLAELDRAGVLQKDESTRLTIAPDHEGLRSFCQELCDREVAAELGRMGAVGARVLWSRSVEALVAWDGRQTLPTPYKPAAYVAAARRGVTFLAGEAHAIRSRRKQTWADTILQILLVPPRNRLSRSHAAILARQHKPGNLAGLARWYGLEEAARRLEGFLERGVDDPEFLPRSEIREIAGDVGVAF